MYRPRRGVKNSIIKTTIRPEDKLFSWALKIICIQKKEMQKTKKWPNFSSQPIHPIWHKIYAKLLSLAIRGDTNKILPV